MARFRVSASPGAYIEGKGFFPLHAEVVLGDSELPHDASMLPLDKEAQASFKKAFGKEVPLVAAPVVPDAKGDGTLTFREFADGKRGRAADQK
jgi:hypothetical protein